MVPQSWGVTAAERAVRYPVDDLAPEAAVSYFRGVDVDAPAGRVFRWLCQLKVAPYSYDWLDNRGRRSPRTLTAGVGRLRVGDRVCTIFELSRFLENDHLTVRLDDSAGLRLFGPVAITYAVRPGRLIAKLNCGVRGDGALNAVRRHGLCWGDLVMMRRQLLNLRDLAESGKDQTGLR